VVDINSLFIIFFIEPLSVEILRETKKKERGQKGEDLNHKIGYHVQ
jgi:hypothetical protein